MSNRKPHDTVHALKCPAVFEDGRRPIMPASAAEILGGAEQVARRPTIAFIADNLGHDLEGAREAEKAADARSCTCHPDDNPPVPCARKYALSECRAAAAGGNGRAAADLSQVGALAGEAVMKQAEAAADHMVQAGLAAMALGNRIRDVADDVAEGLLARAKNLRGTIEAFSDTTLQLQALAAHQRTLLQNFDPLGPQVETTRQ